MVQQQAIIAIFLCCIMIQSVLTVGNLAPSSVFRSEPNFAPRNPGYYGEEVPRMVRYASEFKDPIMKRFKPCYYSPIQCLIKK